MENDFVGNGGDFGGGGRMKRMPPLEDIQATKKKFTGRCRLFVGNMPADMKEQELKDLFAEFGQVSECYMSGKGFAFIRLDTRAHAEAAKETLDGKSIRARSLRVRFAVHGAALKVKELSPYVSNELLFQAFSYFGEVERAVHIVDEKGKPLGEGIVEFARKGGALEAMKRVSEGVFLLTSDPRPVTVEPLDARDDEDGLTERMTQKNNQYSRERELEPRFAQAGTFQAEYGQRWKDLYALEKTKRAELEQSFLEGRQRLEAEMDMAWADYQTRAYREDIRRRQENLDRMEAEQRERMEMIGSRGGAPPFNQAFAAGGGGGGGMGLMGLGGGGGPGGMGPLGGGGGEVKPFGAPPDMSGGMGGGGGFGGGGGGGGEFGAGLAQMGGGGGGMAPMGSMGMGGGGLAMGGGVNELVKMFKEEGLGHGDMGGGFGGGGGGFGDGGGQQGFGQPRRDEPLFPRSNNGGGPDYKRRRR